jgi:hypothetical protein
VINEFSDHTAAKSGNKKQPTPPLANHINHLTLTSHFQVFMTAFQNITNVHTEDRTAMFAETMATVGAAYSRKQNLCKL